MIQVVYDKIVNFCGMNQIPCVIVGSKTDLQQRYVSPHRSPACHPHGCFPYSRSRQVATDEASALAKSIHAEFVETSAKTNTNVGQSHPHFPPPPSITHLLTIPFRRPPAKVFELCLQEIEKRSPATKAEPQPSKCILM